MIVEHGPVGMAIGVAVGIFADIHDISFGPVQMALYADSYHSCRPMYSSFVTLSMADFCGPGRSTCVCLFPGLHVSSRHTAVFRTDRRP